MLERRIRGTEKRTAVEVDSGNDTKSTDARVEEEASEEEGLQVKVNTLPLLS